MFVVELSSHVINACPAAEIVRGVWTSNSGEHRHKILGNVREVPYMKFFAQKTSCTAHNFVSNINKVHSAVDRSQPLFYFVPQEKGLIWRPLWGRKNMGESIFHWEDGPPWSKTHPNWCSHMPRTK